MHKIATSFPDVKDGVSTETLPDGLNPRQCPIIAAHFFGVFPTDLRRHRQAEHLHRLGSRPVLEALVEVAAGRPLDTVLAEYGREVGQ